MAGVTGGYEWPDVGAGNQTGVLCKSKKMLLTTESTLHSQDNSFFFISVFTYLLVILGIKPQALYKSITWPLAIFPSFL